MKLRSKRRSPASPSVSFPQLSAISPAQTPSALRSCPPSRGSVMLPFSLSQFPFCFPPFRPQQSARCPWDHSKAQMSVSSECVASLQNWNFLLKARGWSSQNECISRGGISAIAAGVCVGGCRKKSGRESKVVIGELLRTPMCKGYIESLVYYFIHFCYLCVSSFSGTSFRYIHLPPFDISDAGVI